MRGWIILIILEQALALKYPVPAHHQRRDWMRVGQEELERTLARETNTNVAKNVILFLGDGMGLTTVWASRVYTGQQKHGQSGEEYEMEFEKFNHIGLAKTYNTESQIPDSAATATAFLSGVKANSRTLGVSEKVQWKNCSNEAQEGLDNIVDWSLEKGKSIGVVTTTRITHATSAAMYAHSANRDWESDTDFENPLHGDPVYNSQFQCKDIATQMLDGGSNINVILGGGLRNFLPQDEKLPGHGNSTGYRSDNRNLIKEWKAKKAQSNRSHAFVSSKEQLDEVNVDKTDFLLGLFNPSHMEFELTRDKKLEPSLADMTRKALGILQKSDKGFFLMVEGGRIDHGHHFGMAKLALHDTWAFEEAVKVARQMTEEEDTLLVVTADHSHTFTTGGYPSRGNDILGTVDRPELNPSSDDLPYLTLTYANGPGAPYNNSFGRANHTEKDTTLDNFKQDAIAPMKYETHGGEDVPIYAQGPMAHLFDGVHEQNYIAHAMAYASCVGPNVKHCVTQVDINRAVLPKGFPYVAILTIAYITSILH